MKLITCSQCGMTGCYQYFTYHSRKHKRNTVCRECAQKTGKQQPDGMYFKSPGDGTSIFKPNLSMSILGKD